MELSKSSKPHTTREELTCHYISITSTLVSRLILNLKVAGSEDSNLGTESSMLTSLGTNTRVEELIFGNMVNEMEDSSESATSMDTHSSRDSYKLKTLRRV